MYDRIKESSKKPKWSSIYVMKNFGIQAIEFAGKALEVLESKEDNHEYWQAIFNFRFTRGKVYSKLFDQDPEVQLGYLQQSFREYEKLDKFVKQMFEKHPNTEMTQSMKDQLTICKEMIELLPLKLDKFNKSI